MNNDISSLAHSKWNCKYHIVFAPKLYFILNLWFFPKLVENAYTLFYTLTS